jgi:hypothetical protein
MGEAKCEIARQVCEKDGAEDLVFASLKFIADMLDCAITLKRQDDELLDWPPDSIIGVALDDGTKCRECPFVLEVCDSPSRGAEFEVTTTFLTVIYAVLVAQRGIHSPGSPGPLATHEDVALQAREWFRAGLPAYRAVLPTRVVMAARVAPDGSRVN